MSKYNYLELVDFTVVENAIIVLITDLQLKEYRTAIIR